ncbi:hypothetical protein A4G29_10720 [Mycobacterium kansasii]|nr:hypothetical protein A4G29_10720 [Mycobacterium kansasii]
MNYATLPQEINLLLMFSGAGSSPMVGAAVARDGLASELGSAAAPFQNAGSTNSGPKNAAGSNQAAGIGNQAMFNAGIGNSGLRSVGFYNTGDRTSVGFNNADVQPGFGH